MYFSLLTKLVLRNLAQVFFRIYYLSCDVSVLQWITSFTSRPIFFYHTFYNSSARTCNIIDNDYVSNAFLC